MKKDIFKNLYNFLSPTDEKVKADLIMGFGHFDLRIAKQCALLFNEKLAPKILFTGGVGAGSGDFKNPEAEEFQNYLINNHPEINANNILIEKESTNTSENVENSINILKKKELFDSIHRIILVATPSRQLRVYLTAKKLLPNIELINIPPVSSYEFDLKKFNEKGINFKDYLLGEFDRIKKYPELGYICNTKTPKELETLYKTTISHSTDKIIRMKNNYKSRLKKLKSESKDLLKKKNKKVKKANNGIYYRYKNPVLTAEHIPLTWRFDLNKSTNPNLLERIGYNAVFNAGAIKFNGKYVVIARVEGNDRKSFFAVAESKNGIDNFKFWDNPVTLPETEVPDTNVYDMRVVKHEDGWIYGVFCSERKDPEAPEGDTSSAVASAGIVRTKDLKEWERLPDLITYSGQQRNVVLHPEFVDGKYAFYTRPQDGFIDTGSGGGIGFGLSDTIENAEVKEEVILDAKIYHTIYELKNGLGPEPIKTKHGWLHLAHGVRNTAAGLRYTLYAFMTDLDDLTKITYKPAGYLIAPKGSERIGDVSNVVFSNGWIADDNGKVFIYYASSDTRLHVATTTVDQLVDYCMHTEQDGLRSAASVENIKTLIKMND